jgi:hypothetical protein
MEFGLFIKFLSQSNLDENIECRCTDIFFEKKSLIHIFLQDNKYSRYA